MAEKACMNNSKRRFRKRKQPSAASFQRLTAVVANEKGEIFELEGFAALGADGPRLAPMTVTDTIELPHGSELMFLPDRIPLLMDMQTGQVRAVARNPYGDNERIFPVAAFNSPGVVLTRTCAYEEREGARMLPLFSYGAVGWLGKGFRSAASVVDREPRQDLRRMPRDRIVAGVEAMRAMLPTNRLARHLEHCALSYGCPAGKNFFLGRYEAPLPTSRACNARCLGCISLQSGKVLTSSQNRIAFTPTAAEIAEVALAHIRRVAHGVVSFGQGCEGDPLMAARVIGPAIARIRATTADGTINMNTNASLPHILGPLLDAGLDSIRVSMNSVREACYHAYFRPKGYRFAQVLESIDLALAKGRHVAINYLNCPGFTDTPEEAAALAVFLEKHPIQLIQWRNLNYDPHRYLGVMKAAAPTGPPVGIDRLLQMIRKQFPRLQFGYFNPPKERFAVSPTAPQEETRP
jgi:pyruvate-formate lyase-activating enzyme